MYQGGPSHTKESARIIRYAGLAVPVLLIAYGLGAQAGYFASAFTINSVGFFWMSFWWLYIAIVQFMGPSRTKLDSALRLVGYHLLGSAFLILISGVSSPLASLWILLMLASNIYFSRSGLGYSVLWFILTVAIDIHLKSGHDSNIITYDLIALVAILLSGLVILSVSRTQEVSKLELTSSREKEGLQRDRILTIVNNISDAIVSTDKDGIINVYNAACLNLLDTNNDITGATIDDILKLTDVNDKPVALLAELKRSKSATTRDDLKYKLEDDETLRLEVTYSPIRSSYSRHKKAEAHDGYIVIMRDVTKSKSLEEERDEFISVVSHELRTPITVVEGTISNVQVMMEHGDATKDMLKDAVDTAHDEIVYLASMVNDLSTLSRAERGVSDKPEDIDVREMAHKLHEEYNQEATNKGLHLNLDLGATLDHVYASRLYLEEMLQNFITNAIKYTKEGEVTVSVKQKLGVITFAVKDTGIGISKTDQEKVFKKFYRVEDYRTRETNGNGLGLYVATKLAHKINTNIELVSRLNHGSTFSFKLPAHTKQTTSPDVK
jgi:signal transduction histidine kinase